MNYERADIFSRRDWKPPIYQNTKSNSIRNGNNTLRTNIRKIKGIDFDILEEILLKDKLTNVDIGYLKLFYIIIMDLAGEAPSPK